MVLHSTKTLFPQTCCLESGIKFLIKSFQITDHLEYERKLNDQYETQASKTITI